MLLMVFSVALLIGNFWIGNRGVDDDFVCLL